ncbi:hypothetical protein [Nocardia iowensis]|uniref:Secreted protein n=1 Tax=Nocardia iowensis TaxID=204891 RepID=A0ABX8RZF2_NOCIO|nr:hypothetical protein [Nocardia iowensis]QXN94219.1 hypothetical protein KV110_14850 [Nocardia iowensis]
MSQDWSNVAVAAMTVAGTLGGAVVTQIFAIRGKRIDARLQRALRTDELRELARKEATDEKRSAYADLNSAAHYFRTAARRYLAERRGTESDRERFEAAWEKLRDSYSRAQMVLSDPALAVASEVSRCMDVGRQAVLDVDPSEPAQVTAVDHYLAETLGYAVRLLRRALRDDLGIETPSGAELLDNRRAALRNRRRQFVSNAQQPPLPLPHHP